MIFQITRKRIARNRKIKRDAREQEYIGSLGRTDAAADQLLLFKSCWKDITQHVPYYRNHAASGQVPRQLSSWDEFCSNVPITTKSDVQLRGEDYWDTRRAPDFFRTTGGSTAEPVQLPAWRSELSETEPNEWMARKWYGIEPEDPSFRLWGHSHLLGHGMRGKLNGAVRTLKDTVLGISRVSAYKLSESDLQTAWRTLRATSPLYALGYSGALDAMARMADSISLPTSLRAVIATAESYPRADSAVVIGRAFDCPVASEYGCVEAGAIAHTRPGSTGFEVFWRSYFIEAITTPGTNEHRILITSLYPRCFPLIRYDLGDSVDVSGPLIGVRQINRIIGRSNHFIDLGENVRIHSEAIAHVVKDLQSVVSYQLVNEPEHLELRLRFSSSFNDMDMRLIRERLTKVHPALGAASIVTTRQLYKTRAGKTPSIVKNRNTLTLH